MVRMFGFKKQASRRNYGAIRMSANKQDLDGLDKIFEPKESKVTKIEDLIRLPENNDDSISDKSVVYSKEFLSDISNSKYTVPIKQNFDNYKATRKDLDFINDTLDKAGIMQ